jgi:hypothetical protein
MPLFVRTVTLLLYSRKAYHSYFKGSLFNNGHLFAVLIYRGFCSFSGFSTLALPALELHANATPQITSLNLEMLLTVHRVFYNFFSLG